MAFENIDNLPITWTDYEDIGMKLYERFGDEYNEGKFTEPVLQNLLNGF